MRGPAAVYEFADAEAGSWLWTAAVLGAMSLVSGLGAGIGALVGVVTGGSVGDAALDGGLIGMACLIAWLLLTLVVVAVLWVRGMSPGEAATGQKPHGKHAAGYAWRRHAEPLVPGALVLFFVVMTVVIGADGTLSWHSSRPRHEPTAVVDGTVIAELEPGWFDRGPGKVTIRYAVGAVDYSIDVGRDPGDRFFRTGDVVPVEYVIARPADGRSAWNVESARSDARFGFWVAGICGGLGVLSGAGYVGGRWRSSGRRGG